MTGASSDLSRGVRNGYLSARGVAAGLAMAFALFYSSNLGVERRSLVAFIMTSALVVAVLFTSGVTLTFRRSVPNQENRITLNSYLYTTTALSLIGALITLASVAAYSHAKVAIPNTLLLVTFIYAFFATLDFCFHQALIAYSLFKVSAILDVLTIVMQISIYVILYFGNQVSIAVALFTSLIISYITSTVTAALLLIGTQDPSVKFRPSEMKYLLTESRSYHLYGISNGFADRIDRIVIAWFLPLGLLGKYAVGTSIISFMRFLPEALSRLIVGGQSLPNLKRLNSSRSMKIIGIAGVVLVGSLASRLFVQVFFGSLWMMPFLVFLLYAIQEIARGFYQIYLSRFVSIGDESMVRRLSLALIVLAPILALAGAKAIGLVGVPLGIGIGYLGLIGYLKLNETRNKRGA